MIFKIILFWVRFALIKLLELVFILFSFFSSLVIIAHFLKHVLKVNVIPFKWMLNDTEDGDYGAEWFLEYINTKNIPTLLGLITIKKGLYSAFWWWWRNPVWKFKYLLIPNQGSFRGIHIIKFDSTTKNVQPWVTKTERGTNHFYGTVNGQFNGRYSFTNDSYNIMLGHDTRYIFKYRRL